jgi:polysaccharide export outer membrane protein
MVTASFSADEQTGQMPLKDYVIGPGDIIEISVWKDDALAKDVTVLPDGKISFPLIGDIIAAGKTVEELRKELGNKIKPFVPDPNISLIIRQVNSMFIYIIGRVNSPGRFALNTNVNVLQALAIAGGLNPFAKKNKVSIFRENNGQTQIIEFRYDEVSEGKHLEQNIYLKRGDVIVVP